MGTGKQCRHGQSLGDIWGRHQQRHDNPPDIIYICDSESCHEDSRHIFIAGSAHRLICYMLHASGAHDKLFDQFADVGLSRPFLLLCLPLLFSSTVQQAMIVFWLKCVSTSSQFECKLNPQVQPLEPNNLPSLPLLPSLQFDAFLSLPAHNFSTFSEPILLLKTLLMPS